MNKKLIIYFNIIGIDCNSTIKLCMVSVSFPKRTVI